MIKKTITKLSIDGKFVDFNSIKLVQKTDNHHEFKVILDNDVKEIIGGHTIDKSKEWLGRPLVITFNETEFLGTITDISLANKNGHRGNLIIKGYSPTIGLQGQPHYTSWTGRTLQQIVTDTLETLELGKHIYPTFKEPIEYQAQYNENHFQLLQRLAKQYNQWFYYNGVSIVFGKPKFDNDPIYLEYGADMGNLKLKIQVKDHKQGKLSYNASQNNYLSANSKDRVQGLNELGLHAFETAKSLFKNKTHTPTNINADNKYLIDNHTENQQAEASANLHVIKGKSNKQGLTVGTVIKVNSAKINGKADIDIQNYGEYVIISITHKATHNNHYSSTFTAIPSGIIIPKAPKVKQPKAQQQTAVVTDNADNQGRVKVRFMWQANHLSTSWLRVMSNNAGSSDHHPQNRGLVMIPEVGDDVMVGFEHNNPNFPFVLGSLFHGQNGAGGKTDNNIKSIITKSGNEIIFNDGDGKGSVHINAPSGNSFHLNGDGSIAVFNASGNRMVMDSQGNIDVTAPNHITFNSKKVTFNVADKMQLNVMQKMMVNTPWLMQLVTELYHTQAGKALLTSENEIKIESPELYATGQKKLFLHSDELATLNSKGVAEFRGEQGNKHSNVSEEYEITLPIIPAKVIVHFRPKDDWKGEFGFDWMRLGDTKLFNDKKYEDIVANQYKTGTSDLEEEINEYKGDFKVNKTMFTLLKGEYNAHTIPWKKKEKEKTYYIPWLSILNTKVVTLSLILDIEEEADYLEFDANENFTITPNKIDIKGKTKLEGQEITIECLKEFAGDQTLIIQAYKENPNTCEVESLEAGKLKVWANDATKQKTKKVVFVEIKTPSISSKKELNSTASNEKDRINKYLQQAYIELDPVSDIVSLDLSTDTDFTQFIKDKRVKSSSTKDTTTLKSYLLKKLTAEHKNKYDAHFKAFYFAEHGYDPKGNLSGYSQGANFVAVFKSGNDQTAAHEFLHSFNLPHTFTNKKADKDAEYTYEYAKTDNLLDYSHHVSKNGRKALWHWQWVKANGSIT
jgi:uncharacterized protein involved in type VI secretion and phage assembly